MTQPTQPLSCDDFGRLLGDYLDGDLEVTVRLECEAHLGMCAGCVVLVRTCRATILVYQRHPAEPVPAELHEKIMRRIRPPRGRDAHPSS